MDDAKALLDKLNSEMREGRSIAEIEKAWDHFYMVRSYFEHYHSTDKPIMETVRHLSEGLSTFTAHVREGALSPYGGFRVQISALRRDYWSRQLA
ncbi:hypothetical protein [Bradyrhizobium manausense]|uniref:Uncharacterized protein n=1 Tax=Bradyrhizobium manausense TaxID=989370 RepID=A0A0R3CZZ8_9BRAD|nr:hypothetical protein [Bradyrhizobium manausense]KRQ03078.1 hypothetical protein AOQ71_30400 [Bradyrhizobium manausense]